MNYLLIDKCLTSIHGKFYDLSLFDHPGGKLAKSLIHGRDGTSLFESYHPVSSRDMLLTKLKKYEDYDNHMIVVDNQFEWDDEYQQFSKELRQIAKKYFGKIAKDQNINIIEATKATTLRYFELISIYITCLMIIYYHLHGYWLALIFVPVIVGISGASCLHEGSHFTISRRYWINILFMYMNIWVTSPTIWAYDHVVGHHGPTSIVNKDPDLHFVSSKLLRLTKKSKHKRQHIYQHIYAPIIWIIGVMSRLIIFDQIGVAITGKLLDISIYMTTIHKIFHIISRLVVIGILYIYPFVAFPIIQAIIWAIYPTVGFSILFMLLSQINHMVPEASEKKSTNYFKHQILTSHNFAPDSYIMYLLTGGLNLQIEHHLFPSVSHGHLYDLRPEVKNLCKKYNIQYNESESIWIAICKHFKFLKMMGKQS